MENSVNRQTLLAVQRNEHVECQENSIEINVSQSQVNLVSVKLMSGRSARISPGWEEVSQKSILVLSK